MTEDTPLTDYALVSECHPMLFSNDMNDVPFRELEEYLFDKILTFKEMYTALDRLAETAAGAVDFSQIDRFVNDGESFCSEFLEQSGILAKIRPNQTARTLMMFVVLGGLEELLIEGLSQVIGK